MTTKAAFESFLSTVGSAVFCKMSSSFKPFGANRTLKWSLSRMTSSVYFKLLIVAATFSALAASVDTAVNLSVPLEIRSFAETLFAQGA